MKIECNILGFENSQPDSILSDNMKTLLLWAIQGKDRVLTVRVKSGVYHQTISEGYVFLGNSNGDTLGKNYEISDTVISNYDAVRSLYRQYLHNLTYDWESIVGEITIEFPDKENEMFDLFMTAMHFSRQGEYEYVYNDKQVTICFKDEPEIERRLYVTGLRSDDNVDIVSKAYYPVIPTNVYLKGFLLNDGYFEPDANMIINIHDFSLLDDLPINLNTGKAIDPHTMRELVFRCLKCFMESKVMRLGCKLLGYEEVGYLIYHISNRSNQKPFHWE